MVLEKLKAEMAVLSTCFNISRIMTISRDKRSVNGVQKKKKGDT